MKFTKKPSTTAQQVRNTRYGLKSIIHIPSHLAINTPTTNAGITTTKRKRLDPILHPKYSVRYEIGFIKELENFPLRMSSAPFSGVTSCVNLLINKSIM